MDVSTAQIQPSHQPFIHSQNDLDVLFDNIVKQTKADVRTTLTRANSTPDFDAHVPSWIHNMHVYCSLTRSFASQNFTTRHTRREKRREMESVVAFISDTHQLICFFVLWNGCSSFFVIAPVRLMYACVGVWDDAGCVCFWRGRNSEVPALAKVSLYGVVWRYRQTLLSFDYSFVSPVICFFYYYCESFLLLLRPSVTRAFSVRSCCDMPLLATRVSCHCVFFALITWGDKVKARKSFM